MPLISDPHSTNFWSGYSVNPGENINPPPAGAPEGWQASQVNDVVRRIMAGLRQLGNYVGALNNALGTMAGQNANAVSITGGSIAASTLAGTVNPSRLFGLYSGVTAGNSERLGGLTLQDVYNHIHPLGSLMILVAEFPPPVPLGVAATWQKFGAGRVLKGVASGAGVEGGSAVAATSVGGQHAHAAGSLGNGPPSATRQANLGGGLTNVASQDHWHNIFGSTAEAGLHSHTVPVDPPHVTVVFWRRVF